MLRFSSFHIINRIFFWIWTFRSASLRNCIFFCAMYSKGKILEPVPCLPAFSLKGTNSYSWVLLSRNKEIKARRTSTTAGTSSQNSAITFSSRAHVVHKSYLMSLILQRLTNAQKWTWTWTRVQFLQQWVGHFLLLHLGERTKVSWTFTSSKVLLDYLQFIAPFLLCWSK